VIIPESSYDFSGGNHRACKGCGTTDPVIPSRLTAAECTEDGLLPYACPRCGRHVHPTDVRLWLCPELATLGRA